MGPLPVHFVGKAERRAVDRHRCADFADIWSNSATDVLHLCGLATGIWVGLQPAGLIYLRSPRHRADEERRGANLPCRMMLPNTRHSCASPENTPMKHRAVFSAPCKS